MPKNIYTEYLNGLIEEENEIEQRKGKLMLIPMSGEESSGAGGSGFVYFWEEGVLTDKEEYKIKGENLNDKRRN